MTYVTLRSDFAKCSEYRLLAVEADCVRRLKEKIAVHGNEEASTRTGMDENRTLLMMKGTSNLLLCDDEHTYRLRRVEYSNTLLLAEKRPICDRNIEALTHTPVQNSSAPVDLEKKCKYVVVRAAERLFEAKRACVYRDLLKLLKESPVTIEELESENSARPCDLADARMAPPDGVICQHYTFPQLVSMSRCSARELSEILSEAGAIAYRGRVRLLHPSLLREALQAVIVFVECCEEVSWGAVEEHFCPSVYPSIVIRVVQKMYGALEQAEGRTGAVALLHVRKVLQTLAEAAILLLTARSEEEPDRQFHMDENFFFPSVEFESFYNTWVESIPSSFFASGVIPPRSEKAALTSLLNDVVVVRGACGDCYAGATVVWAPQDELSTDLSQRMEQLFELNPGRWEVGALRAYVEPLLDPGVVFEQVVHRHAKEFRAPNQPLRYGRLV
ncbi:hypothetical protein, conserved [Trypanosoma cruzi]|uniref:Sister chromatid cohesion protein DCC1 n=1 Tax=Trypanosoma cruzi (strain CL Brener) TaxID=353153 RepID=Q4E1C9_TRYCC|nr:hypothetical protein, conserved [Trypanosoma cruzi]EAN98578.1 hypothetical protein, conserved [Trypanosoma cruzi]|eukprot:XP_820429.1 hypothetical protein [Trypanosoma cruzi strain CL Brener]